MYSMRKIVAEKLPKQFMFGATCGQFLSKSKIDEILKNHCLGMFCVVFAFKWCEALSFILLHGRSEGQVQSFMFEATFQLVRAWLRFVWGTVTGRRFFWGSNGR